MVMFVRHTQLLSRPKRTSQQETSLIYAGSFSIRTSGSSGPKRTLIHTCPSKLSIYDASLNKWKTILRLANQWHFAEVKDLAFRELDIPGKFSLSIVERIVLYRQYASDRKYLEPLYAQLLSRSEPLTVEEGQSLGITSALLISGARERLRATSDRLAPSAPLPDSMKGTIQEMVGSIFWNGPAPDLSCFANGPTSESFSLNGLDTASSSTGANGK